MHWVYGDNWVKTLLKTILLCGVLLHCTCPDGGFLRMSPLQPERQSAPVNRTLVG